MNALQHAPDCQDKKKQTEVLNKDMYKKILMPVDLAHTTRLGKALTTAADLSRHYKAPVCYVGVTTETPSSIAHNPAEFMRKLAAFAAEQAGEHAIETSSHAITTHDPAIDLDAALIKAATDTDADLIVMASHIPNVADYLWASNGGTVAAHARISVFLVRES